MPLSLLDSGSVAQVFVSVSCRGRFRGVMAVDGEVRWGVFYYGSERKDCCLLSFKTR